MVKVMFNKLKTNLAIKWLNQNIVAPKWSLNSTDKLYLAVSMKNTGKLTYIYTLGNMKTSGNQWNLTPTISVSTFNKRKEADIFYKTLLAIMELQHKNPGVQVMVSAYQNEIKSFKENTR